MLECGVCHLYCPPCTLLLLWMVTSYVTPAPSSSPSTWYTPSSPSLNPDSTTWWSLWPVGVWPAAGVSWGPRDGWDGGCSWTVGGIIQCIISILAWISTRHLLGIYTSNRNSLVQLCFGVDLFLWHDHTQPMTTPTRVRSRMAHTAPRAATMSKLFFSTA